MERRRIRRKRTRLPVRLEPGNITSMTADLGAEGIFLYSARVHKPGTRVRLVLKTPTGVAEVHGVVRWAKRVPTPFLAHVRGGMGIQFTWVSDEFRAYLAGLNTAARPSV